MNQNQKLITKLIALEKRAATLSAKAKTYTEISHANTMKFNARMQRAALVAQGIL